MIAPTRVSFAALREAVHSLDIRSRIEGVQQDGVVIEWMQDGGVYLHLDVPDGHPCGYPALTLGIQPEPRPGLA